MAQKDGGPAFPTNGYDTGAAMQGIGVSVTEDPGMTIRDWFAGQALNHATRDIWEHHKFEDVADRAYRYADAMLKAREATQ